MPRELSHHPIHLGLGATAISETGVHRNRMVRRVRERHTKDGVEGRLVAMHSFRESWNAWEVHPRGHEVVLCTAGEMTLVQEIDGREVRTRLRAGEYAINEPGIWHTADVEGSATAVFITAGVGTEHRPR